MVNLDELTDKDLHSIGERVLSELNINLFNAEPTIHKAYQVYVELVQVGYKEKNKQLACEKIKKFFKTRTVRNQRKEFQMFFGIPYSDEMRPFLALSFRTSEIDSELVRKVSFKTDKILCNLYSYNSLKIDEKVLMLAINELYKPRYYENEWRTTISSLFEKIKAILVSRGEVDSIDSLEEIFYVIDPDPKKKKRSGLILVKEDIDSKMVSDGTEVSLVKRRLDHQQVCVARVEGSEFEETSLTRANIIKDSELAFVKGILELINSDEVYEQLSVDLYQNDYRHPLITNFINLVSSYNRIMSNKEMNLREALSGMRVVVRALRETGEKTVKSYQEIVEGRVQAIEFDLKKAS